jgi:hypothetical protein
MNIADYLVLAVASALWPTLIAIVILALTRPNPARLLLFFVLGGLLTTIGMGLAIVFLVQGSQIVSGSRPPADPILDLTVGLLALVVAFLAHRREGRPAPVPKKPESKPSDAPSWSARLLERGAFFALVLGIVINVMPGFFYLVALKDIAEGDYSSAEVVVLVIVFCLLMFALVELPLVGYLVAPAKTGERVDGFNAWLRTNKIRLVRIIATVIGVYLVVRGTIALVD